MLYVLLARMLVIVSVLMLRLRLRLEITPGRRLLFAGLGRTGSETDFGRRVRTLKLCGIDVSRSTTAKKKRAGVKPEIEKPKEAEQPTKRKRRRPLFDIVAIIPQCTSAVWRYLGDLLGSAIVEDAEGEIRGGFDSPDLTGRAFGYYQALIAMAPASAGRIRYIPDWQGASFSGTARLSVALPLWRFLWLTLLMIWRLPLRKIIRLAIGTKEGVQDDQQRS